MGNVRSASSADASFFNLDRPSFLTDADCHFLLAPRFGLDRSIWGGLVAATSGSIGVLLVSVFHPTFLPFLAAISVFLLGMGIVNPLGTAQALSPFGEKAGAASALLGFWQMMGAAIGVYLAATVSHQAMFALGIVLTVASLAAVALYAMRAKPSGRGLINL